MEDINFWTFCRLKRSIQIRPIDGLAKLPWSSIELSGLGAGASYPHTVIHRDNPTGKSALL